MTTPEILALVSGLITGGSLAYAYICLRKYENLIRLVGEASEICFLCYKPQLGHDILEGERSQTMEEKYRARYLQDYPRQYQEPLDPVHDYMPALLLYFPDPDLR